MPPTVAARVKLLLGDVEGANELLQDSGAEGSLEWTPYYLALSKYELSQGKPGLARSALALVAPGTREECEVLIARRQVARALDDQREVQNIQDTLERMRSAFDPQQAWSAKGALSVCIDPERAAARFLTVELVAEKPSSHQLRLGWRETRNPLRPRRRDSPHSFSGSFRATNLRDRDSVRRTGSSLRDGDRSQLANRQPHDPGRPSQAKPSRARGTNPCAGERDVVLRDPGGCTGRGKAVPSRLRYLLREGRIA